MLLVLLTSGIVRSPGQSIRLQTMGDLTTAVPDSEYGLNAYDLGRNPAWLLPDERADWLRILPGIEFTEGSYRRLYDPERITQYGAAFDGISVLGDAGTFRGSTAYTVDQRFGVYRSVKRSPYAGEAFFLRDTTTGDVTYRGPVVHFEYAYEVLPALYAGVAVTYRILDGLKEIYSNTKTQYREVGGTIGIAVVPGPGLVIGATYAPSSVQERIEAKSDDLLDVEIAHFRGETYSYTHRSASIDHTISARSHEFGAHLFWQPGAGTTLGMLGSYTACGQRDLVSREQSIDQEDGYTDSERINGQVVGRIPVTDRLDLSLFSEFHSRTDWSRYTKENLTLWRWHEQEINAGAGFSYALQDRQIVVGLEYRYILMKLDSAKYIDNRYHSLYPATHVLRTGLEVLAADGVAIRAGLAWAASDTDPVAGQGRVTWYRASAGGLIALSSSVRLDLLAEYSRSYTSVASRSTLGGTVRLTLASP